MQEKRTDSKPDYISLKSQATEVIISSTTTMKPTKKSDDDSLSIYPNEIIRTPALRKKQMLAVSNITTTVAPLAHRWQRWEQICLLHFRVLNLKNFSMNPANQGVSGTDSDEQSLNNSASSVFHLWQLKASSWFQNSSILLAELL